MVAAAFHTVSDAAVRRRPAGGIMSAVPETTGVRGGTMTFDDEAGTVALEGVRFVQDVAVSGQVTPDPSGEATAELRVGDDRELILSWSALSDGRAPWTVRNSGWRCP